MYININHNITKVKKHFGRNIHCSIKMNSKSSDNHARGTTQGLKLE